MELYRQVKDSWLQDYYKEGGALQANGLSSPLTYKRRSPFVPFALKNDTGLPLQFTTFVTDTKHLKGSRGQSETTDRWDLVAPGETVPFSFTTHSKFGFQFYLS